MTTWKRCSTAFLLKGIFKDKAKQQAKAAAQPQP